MNWQGKTAFITGGVSGIGFGIARAFAEAGMDLILSYRNEAYRADAEAWFVQNERPLPRFVKLDVTDRAGFAAAAAEAGAAASSLEMETYYGDNKMIYFNGEVIEVIKVATGIAKLSRSSSGSMADSQCPHRASRRPILRRLL